MKYDPTSAEPVLFLVGPPLPNIPDTDLSANQLARIAWNRDTDLEDIAEWLLGSGSYSLKPKKKEPVTPAKPEELTDG